MNRVISIEIEGENLDFRREKFMQENPEHSLHAGGRFALLFAEGKGSPKSGTLVEIGYPCKNINCSSADPAHHPTYGPKGKRFTSRPLCVECFNSSPAGSKGLNPTPSPRATRKVRTFTRRRSARSLKMSPYMPSMRLRVPDPKEEPLRREFIEWYNSDMDGSILGFDEEGRVVSETGDPVYFDVLDEQIGFLAEVKPDCSYLSVDKGIGQLARYSTILEIEDELTVVKALVLPKKPPRYLEITILNQGVWLFYRTSDHQFVWKTP